MNPAKDVEYPDLVGTPDEPVEPSNEADPDPEIPAEHAIDQRSDKKADVHHPDAKHAPHPLDRPKDNDFNERDDLGVEVI